MTESDGNQPRAVLFTDADNTLWDTNSVYAAAQNWLLDEVEFAKKAKALAPDRLALVRRVDQLLAATHHAGLRYPPKLLANALAMSLNGVPEERAARRAWSEPNSGLPETRAQELEAGFDALLKQTPSLRTGVACGLQRLNALGVSVFVLTEGGVERVRRTLDQLSIAQYVDRVLEGKKEARLYRRVLKLMGEPATAFMAGDQLDRDIAPAKMAGLVTFYFPGGFTPSWTPNEAQVVPSFKVESFLEISNLIAAQLAARRRVPA